MIKETANTEAIDLAKGVTLTILGEAAGGADGLDGAGKYRGLFVYAGDVAIENLTIQHTAAIGGAGTKGGGGGAELGGGLFVGTSADVTLTQFGFSGDLAQGGAGAAGTGRRRRRARRRRPRD